MYHFRIDEALVNHVDLNFPERAVVGMGTENLNLTFGRDVIFRGSGHTGSLTLRAHLDYYEFLRFTTWYDAFKYTYIVSGFDSLSWISSSQNSTFDDDDTINYNRGVAEDEDNIKLYTAHRFEFVFFPKQDKF